MLAIGLGVLAGILFALLTVLVRRGIMRTPDPIAGSVVVVGLAMIIVIVESLVSGHASDLLEFHPALAYFTIGLIAPGEIDPVHILLSGVIMRGLEVGSREMFAALTRSVIRSAFSAVSMTGVCRMD